MKITASEVNKLRQATGAGMMDCKKALVEAEGDFDKAVENLRKKGQKVAANTQGDGIIHYLGNSGASPPECTGDVGRYWYYHSEDGGLTFSQCYAVPGGWSTIASQRHGSYVYIAQEDADTNSGEVVVRISDD